jgi:hypothetical protein
VFYDLMNDSDFAELSVKLRAWKTEPEAPPSFQREVWQRIAARQTMREEALWPRVREWFYGRLVRPRYAVALVALSLFTSIGVARFQARETNTRHWEKLEARYASSIDPLAMTR